MNKPIQIPRKRKRTRPVNLASIRSKAKQPTPECIYEVVDITNEKSRCPLGLFPSLQDAITAIEDHPRPWKLSPSFWSGEHACLIRFEIRQRPLGFSGIGKPFWSRAWHEFTEGGKSVWIAEEMKP